jgi:hypothetical protein
VIDYFRSLPEDARRRLTGLANRVRSMVPVDTGSLLIQTSKLDPEVEQNELLDNLSSQTSKGPIYLYYFHAVNNFDLAAMERAFKHKKAEEKNERRYPRFNRRSEFLYVGSSSYISLRFKEHLGYASGKTYSIQLAHWAYGLNLELEFVYAKYPSGLSRDVIQAIEDTLWDTLLPMFGRRGPR